MQFWINVVVLASTYALLAVGYVLVYRASRVLNLAQGELMMLAGYLLFALAQHCQATGARDRTDCAGRRAPSVC